MYNVLDLASKKNRLVMRILLSIEEMTQLFSHIVWTEYDEILSPKNDILLAEEYSHLDIDVLKENYITCLSTQYAGEFFTIDETIDYLICPLNNPFPPIFGEQVMPIDSRPTFENYYTYIWREDMMVFEVRRKNKKLFFIHPNSYRVLFIDENQYIEYLNYYESMKTYFESITPDKQRLVRVINVYDKKSNKLKYRILNPEFEKNSIGQIYLNPIEGDEYLFLRSYEITKPLAKKIKYIYNFDFDFEKNRYFFETLNAEDFTMSYEELKDLLGKK